MAPVVASALAVREEVVAEDLPLRQKPRTTKKRAVVAAARAWSEADPAAALVDRSRRVLTAKALPVAVARGPGPAA